MPMLAVNSHTFVQPKLSNSSSEPTLCTRYEVGEQSCPVKVCASTTATVQRRKRGDPKRATGGVVNNNHIIIWPKGAHALFEVGLNSGGDDTKQLNNAEQTGADVYTLSQQFVLYTTFVFLF